ncbi:MAG: hypothetical protein HKL82_05850 [Acidimicrobiaceae bacterium]|nr:hypothetical protein [Acidimicrobiaceae bacterium]
MKISRAGKNSSAVFSQPQRAQSMRVRPEHVAGAFLAVFVFVASLVSATAA